MSRIESKPADLTLFAWPLTSVLAFVLPFVLIGCAEQPAANYQATSKSSATNQSTKASKNLVVTNNSPKADQAVIIQPAAGFLKAIIQGDPNEAKQWLTPMAKQQVEKNEGLLNPLGFKVEKLEIGRVVTTSPKNAAVEFMIVEVGGNENEEVCCLMKQSSVGWRVAGIACGAGPGEAPSVISFEHGLRKKVSQPKPKPSIDQYVDAAEDSGTVRTAQQPTSALR